MRVQQLAERTGVSGHAVRYYARLGLLNPARDPDNDYRRFDEAAVQRLRFVRKAQSLGFALAEIKEILNMTHHGDSPCPVVREIVERRIAENAARIRELLALQARLQRAAKRWKRMPNRLPDGHAVCHLIESFGEED